MVRIRDGWFGKITRVDFDAEDGMDILLLGGQQDVVHGKLSGIIDKEIEGF